MWLRCSCLAGSCGAGPTIETEDKRGFTVDLLQRAVFDEEISNLWSLRSACAARSPMTRQGAMVLPVVTRGMIERLHAKVFDSIDFS